MCCNTPIRIVSNTFTSHLGVPVVNTLFLYIEQGNANPSTVTDNNFIGLGGTGEDRSLEASYPVQGPAINFYRGVGEVSRNHITNAYQGISLWNASTVTATDNVIQTTYAPFSGKGGTADNVLTANWNDLSDYVTVVSTMERINAAALNIRAPSMCSRRECEWAKSATTRISSGVYTVPYSVA